MGLLFFDTFFFVHFGLIQNEPKDQGCDVRAEIMNPTRKISKPLVPRLGSFALLTLLSLFLIARSSKPFL